MTGKPSSRGAFRFAIFCALPVEYDAVRDSLDEVWPNLGRMGVPGDPNRYVAGSMGDIPVVLVLLPGMGKSSAASAAASLRSSFANVQCALLVGICGAAPKNGKAEIMLGDVIIGKYVVQYDFGRQYPDELKPKNRVQDTLGRPNKEIRILNALWETRAERAELKSQTTEQLFQLQKKLATTEDSGLYDYYGIDNDKLFESDYRHMHQDPACCSTCRQCSGSTDMVCGEALNLDCAKLQCSNEKIIVRERRRRRLELGEENNAADQGPAIHIGGIASADSVMKSGQHRDRICERESVIAFEMEGAGIWDEMPCLIVKGVCDYADSHKDKAWHNYASATAASAAKAILKGFFEAYKMETDHSNHVSHFIPFLRNEYFVGREEVIADLYQLLFVDNKRNAVLVGLGGMGKTQVALEFAYKTVEKMASVSVIWLPAFSIAGYELACSELVRKWQIPCQSDDDSKHVIKDYLESQYAGNWLLIIDNADDEAVLYGTSSKGGGIYNFLPKNQNGRTLVTTRHRKIAVEIGRSRVFDLQQMSLGDAQTLFRKLLISPHVIKNDEVFIKLLETLCYLPLAMSQAAAYLNMNQISIEKYLNICLNSSNDFSRLLEISLRDETYYTESQSAVATTWLISFSQISNNCPRAAQLLLFISWIEPKAIPLSLLPQVESEEEKTMAIGILKGYGFLSSREEDEVVDMHSLVHFVMQKCLQNQTTRLDMNKFLSHMEKSFPSGEWKDQDLWQQYMPHVLRLYWRLENQNIALNARLGFRIGCCLSNDRRDQEALAVLKSVVVTRRRTLAEDNPARLASQQALARVYRRNGQLPEAAALLKDVIAFRQRTLPEDHPDRLISQHALATVYYNSSQLTEAAALLKDVVAIQQRILPEDHPHRLASRHTLARVYRNNGQLTEAAALLEDVIAIQQRILTEDHPNQLASRHALATVYRDNGQLTEAAALLEDVVAIRQRTLPEDHPHRLASRHALATVYRDNDQLTEAAALLEDVIAIQQRILTEDHPDRLASRHTLATVYRDNDQLTEAAALLEDVVAIRQRTLAEDHPDRLASRHALATVYRDNSQLTEAAALLEDVVAIQQKTLPEGHPNRLLTQHTLATVYHGIGRTYEAVYILKGVVSLRRKTLRDGHPALMDSESLLAEYLRSNTI